MLLDDKKHAVFEFNRAASRALDFCVHPVPEDLQEHRKRRKRERRTIGDTFYQKLKTIPREQTP